MNDETEPDRKELLAELATIRRRSGRINTGLWGLAVVVMIFSTGYVTELAFDHGAPPETAWMLSLMVDIGLCVSLWADRPLSEHGRTVGWLSVLRWSCAGMTWALNVAGAVWPPHGGPVDWVGVGVRSCGPVILVVVAEAAVHVQQELADIAAGLEVQARAARQRKPAPAREDHTPVRTEAARPVRTAPAQASRTDDRPTKDEFRMMLVERFRSDASYWPSLPDLAAESGWGQSWCEKRRAEAKAEAAGPARLEAVR